jgi:hypothetical protein
MVRLPGEQPMFKPTMKQKPRNTKQEKIAPRNKPSGKTLIAHSFRPRGTARLQRQMAGLKSAAKPDMAMITQCK